MTNNIVLDVAIGLVFIYLLYSLLASAISELVATLFAYRSRMLERGLEQMLDGRNYSVYWWDKLLMNILMAIKSVVNKARGTDKNKIQSAAIKPGPNQKALAYCASFEKTIISKTDICKKTQLFATAITAHPLYRRSAENSVFFKKPAYLPASVFTDILIDVLGPEQTDKPVLLKEIATNVDKMAAEASEPLNDELAKIIRIYLAQANGDMQRFRLLVENWYDETMNRVSGWYKKQTFRVLLIIGFILACIFNVNTIAIVQTLSTNKDVRDAMVKGATEYVKTHPNGPTNKQTASPAPAPADTAKNAKQKKAAVPAETIDAQKKAADSALRKGIDSVKAVYALIEPHNASLGLGWGDFGFKKDSLTWVKGKDSLKKLIAVEKDPVKIKALNKTLSCWEKKEPHNGFWHKLWYILGHINLLGIFLTALAISLGAPFWFDLLNKFINLRVSGAKPEAEPSAAKKTAAANKPSPQSFG